MSEAPRQNNPTPEKPEQGPKSPVRRRLLKGAGAVVGLGVAATVLPPILFPQGISPEASDNPTPVVPRPEGLSEDTLTEEELADAHIRIIPTDDVKLHLRKGVFDFPVFKDAKEDRLKEAVIVLVDHPSLSWNAGYELPTDARLVYQTGVINPSERSRSEWRSELSPEEVKKAIEAESEKGEAIGLIKRFDYPYSSGLGGSDVYDYLMGKGYVGDAKRVERVIRAQYAQGLKNKVFIFVAVGGGRKPHPDQSYLSPSQFEKIPGAHAQSGYSNGTYKYMGDIVAGKILRHEISHYNAGSFSKSEYDADTGMFKSIEKAWGKYQEAGDTSGYPFVFVTEEGMTFTKKRQAQSASTQSA